MVDNGLWPRRRTGPKPPAFLRLALLILEMSIAMSGQPIAITGLFQLLVFSNKKRRPIFP